jgi:flagellar M-ring protein FliF
MEAGGVENPGLVPNSPVGAVPHDPNVPMHIPPEGTAAAPARMAFFKGLADLPRNRQIAVIAGVALSIAVAVAVILWSQAPDYSTLFNNLPDKEMGEVMDVLEKLNIPHKVDSHTGTLQVPSDKVHEVRLKLAAQGLPKDGSQGFELLDQDRGFGTSQMMETARYHRALEGEIARSIATLHDIKAVRVHLAFPKETVFVREKKKPSASVMVRLNPGAELVKEQVDAIVHLVASSVPQMEPDLVTVVDQAGRLLSSKNRLSERANEHELNMTNRQFEYKKEVEEHLIGRINNILRPVVGEDGLSAQVSVDIDFNVTERTQEMFNPESPAMRSEQTSEEQKRGSEIQGVPGALTNQPPAAGTAPEVATGQAGQAGTEKSNVNRSATRNYELDRTISHTRVGLGYLRRVSAAVVVDNRKVWQDDGSSIRKPYSEEELARFSDLVKEAVGFDATRNDRVTVTNAAFRDLSEEPVVTMPVWEQPWFWPLARQIFAAIVLLIILFGFLRPLFRLMIKGEEAAPTAAEAAAAREAAEAAAAEAGAEAELAEDKLTLSPEEELMKLEGPESEQYKRLQLAQKLIDEDPKRVAQLIKAWLASDG